MLAFLWTCQIYLVTPDSLSLADAMVYIHITGDGSPSEISLAINFRLNANASTNP